MVETENATECETIFHNLLAPLNVKRPGNGKEFFKMDSDDHMRQIIEEVKDIVTGLQRERQAVEKFEKAQCTQQLLEPVASDMEFLSQLRTIETRLLELGKKPNV